MQFLGLPPQSSAPKALNSSWPSSSRLRLIFWRLVRLGRQHLRPTDHDRRKLSAGPPHAEKKKRVGHKQARPLTPWCQSWSNNPSNGGVFFLTVLRCGLRPLPESLPTPFTTHRSNQSPSITTRTTTPSKTSGSSQRPRSGSSTNNPCRPDPEPVFRRTTRSFTTRRSGIPAHRCMASAGALSPNRLFFNKRDVCADDVLAGDREERQKTEWLTERRRPPPLVLGSPSVGRVLATPPIKDAVVSAALGKVSLLEDILFRGHPR